MKKKRYEDWEEKVGITSFTPLEIIELQESVMAGEKDVIIGNRLFSLKYEGDVVFFKPVEGDIPCGFFKLSKLLEFE